MLYAVKTLLAGVVLGVAFYAEHLRAVLPARRARVRFLWCQAKATVGTLLGL